MLLFIQDPLCFPLAVESAKKQGIAEILAVSEKDLGLPAAASGVAVESRLLSDFMEPDLDWEVNRRLDALVCAFCEKNFLFCRQLSQRSRVSVPETLHHIFRARLYPLLRKSSLAARVMGRHPQKRTVCDGGWSTVLELCQVDFQNLSPVPANTTPPALRRAAGLSEGAARAAREWAFFVLGAAATRNARKNLLSSQILFLGGAQSPAFEPVWKKIRSTGAQWGELFISREIQGQVKDKARHPRQGTVEGLLEPADLAAVALDTAILLGAMAANPPDYSLTYPKPSPAPLVLDLDRALLNSIPSILALSRAAEKLAKKGALRRFISVKTGRLFSVVSQVLQRHGVETVAVNHGMVLDPLSYQTNASLKITWGGLDSRLMARYSRDRSFAHFRTTPMGLARQMALDEKPAPPDWTGLLGDRPMDCEEIVQKADTWAGIFPSSYKTAGEYERFFAPCMDHLLTNQAKYGFDAILVKLHPFAHVPTVVRIVARVIRSMGRKTAPVPLVVARTLETAPFFENMRFAFCSHSSILLDLLRTGTPFSLFLAGSLLDRTMVDRLPGWMRFSRPGDLEINSPMNREEFAPLARELSAFYWKADGLEPRDMVSRLVRGLKVNPKAPL